MADAEAMMDGVSGASPYLLCPTLVSRVTRAVRFSRDEHVV